MNPQPHDPIEVVHSEPAIWVSRVVILASLEPRKEIRSIPLNRGLNIVWSSDEGSSDQSLLTGHGVGKTTLCRLIRFCLGEGTFGHAELMARVKAEYPGGWVAAEVRVNGVKWSVARSLARTRSYAKAGLSIEALFADRPASNSYDDFKRALAASALGGFPTAPFLGGNKSILWDHLLGWCARDQEARFQDMLEWRSSRSGAESLAFQRPRHDPALIVRASLGMLTDQETELQSRIPEIERLQRETSRQIEDRKREPEYWINRLRSELATRHQLEDALHASLDRSELLSLPVLIRNRRDRYDSEIKSLEASIKDLDLMISLIAARLTEIKPLAAQREAAVNVTRTGCDSIADRIAQLEGEKLEIERNRERLCTFGNIRFGDCDYVHAYVHDLHRQVIELGRSTSRDIAIRDQATAEMQDLATRSKNEILAVHNQLHAAVDERRRVEQSVSSLLAQRASLAQIESELAKWRAFLGDTSADHTLKCLIDQERRLRAELEQASSRISEFRQGLGKRLEGIRETFDGVIQAAVSPTMRGAIQMVDGTLKFSILHGDVLAGEAIDSLGVLLFDLTWLLLGIAGRALSPRLLIHDSPREADLGTSAYACYLAYVGSLHDRLGGAESAPFQYIVTTTTAPPGALRSKKYVCLRLSSETDDALLFRCRLGQPPPDPQSRLPLE
jgi:uncharacterized protein YydD (DUF2326 family)